MYYEKHGIVYPYFKDKLLVLSRSAAKDFSCDKPWACISVAADPGDWPKINKVQQVDLLQLAFADNEYDWEDKSLFSPQQAKQILEFVEKNWDKIEVLMIHCYAGISRSPAIAAAIAKLKYQDNSMFFQLHTPNKLVYNTILKVAKEIL
jgi:predicted protein tyrosine phosphatase